MTTPNSEGFKLSRMFYICIFLDMMCVALVVPQMAHHMALLSTPEETTESDGTSNKQHSALLFGTIQGIYGFMQILSTPIMGALSDSWGKKPVLLMSVAGTSLAYWILTIALWQRSMMLFFLSRVLVGGIRQTLSTASAYISEGYGVKKGATIKKVKKEGDTATENADDDEKDIKASDSVVANVSKGMSYLQASGSLGFMVGPVIGGYLATYVGDFAPCLVSFAVDAVNFLLLFVLLPSSRAAQKQKVENPTSDEPTKKVRKQRPNPIRFLFRILFSNSHKAARSLLISMYLFSSASIALHTAVGSIGKEIFGASPLQTGAMMSLSSGASAFFLMIIMPRVVNVISYKKIVVCTALVSVTFYAGQLLSPTLLSFAAFEVLSSVTNSANSAVNKAKFSTMFPPDKSGEAFAVIFSLDGINRVLMPVTTGVLAQLVTVRAKEFISGRSLHDDLPTPTSDNKIRLKSKGISAPPVDQSYLETAKTTILSIVDPVTSVASDLLLRAVVTSTRAVCVASDGLESGVVSDWISATMPALPIDISIFTAMIPSAMTGPLSVFTAEFWETDGDATNFKAKSNGTSKSKAHRHMFSFCRDTVDAPDYREEHVPKTGIKLKGAMQSAEPKNDKEKKSQTPLAQTINTVFRWDDLEAESIRPPQEKKILLKSLPKKNEVGSSPRSDLLEVALEQRQRASQLFVLFLSVAACAAMLLTVIFT